MVKIRELSDSQLISQIEKYEKIYFQLVNERDKRIDSKGDRPEFHTKRERSLKVAEKKAQSGVEKTAQEPDNENTQAFHLKFDDSEIAQINEAEKAIEVNDENTRDEVRVTQLLRLSKEQLAELKGGQKAKKVVKKKVVKKKVKK